MNGEALILRHLAFEDAGAFAPILSARFSSVRVLDMGVNDLPRDPSASDALIVLGGPIGVYETQTYPWLEDEIAFVRARLLADRPTFGICLGAQIMAAAMGAEVRPMGVKEIGFSPITLTEAGRSSCLSPFAVEPTTLHWHGDMFALPAGATLLASSDVCQNQAFALGRSVGCQFHPEAGGPGFERWLIGHAVELAGAGVDPVSLRADAARHGAALATKAERIISAWLDRLR